MSKLLHKVVWIIHSSCFFWVTVVIWLVYFLLHNGLIDYLMNCMNNTCSLSPPLFCFSLITTPSPSNIHFSLPLLKLIIVKESYVLKQSEFTFSWLDHSDVFFGLHYNWLLLSFSSKRVLFPLIISCFTQYKPLAYPKTLCSSHAHWQQLNNLYGLDCMSLICCWAKIYFIFLKSCHIWLLKGLFANQSCMQEWVFSAEVAMAEATEGELIGTEA